MSFLNKIKILFLTCLILSINACHIKTEFTNQKVVTQGNLLIWHSFTNNDAQVFNSILNEYRSIHPNVKLVSEYVSEKNIGDRLIAQSQSGFGPDLAIVWHSDIYELIKKSVIIELDAQHINLSQYLPVTINHIKLNNKIYALPFSIDVQVLCYHKNKIKNPAKTLSELLQQSKTGIKVGITSDFISSFWGVGSMGGKFLDQQGNLKFPKVAWSQWLKWLQKANIEPNTILNEEKQLLQEAFIKGELDYYTCESIEISELKNKLPKNSLGISLLPHENNQPATPFIYTEVIVLNKASSPKQQQLALQIANFLTNTEQQEKFAIQAESQIPVNIESRVDYRLSPIQAILFKQAQDGISISLDHFSKTQGRVGKRGNELYYQVLAGEITAEEAANQMNQLVNSINQENRRKK
ncbi:MAG: extracellular solute-binding protein [Phormidium sp.]